MFALDQVREERTKLYLKKDPLISQTERIANKALGESRNLTREEDKELRDLNSQIGRIDEAIRQIDDRIEELERNEALTEERAKRPSLNSTPPSGPSPWDNIRHGEERSRAITAIERSASVPDESRSRLVSAIEADDDQSDPLANWALATSSPEYLRAFAKLLADPMTAAVRMTDDEARAMQHVGTVQRAMSLTDANGGFMVPFTLDPTILLTNNGVEDPIRRIARTVIIATDKWHGVSSAGTTASWDAEGSTVSDDSFTMEQPTITPHRLTAFIPFTIEAGQDAAGFASEMQRVIADSFDTAEGTGFWVGAGDGSTQPYGVITALDANTNVEVATTTNDTFSVADVYKVQEALPARFRRNATWSGDVQVLNKVRRFGEGTTGSNSAFWADLGADQPPLLLGRPVVEASAMETFDATGTENILVFGDFSRYVIVDRVGTTVEIIPHLFDQSNGNRPSGHRGFYAFKRTGGDVVVDNAFRLLQS